MPLRSGSSGYGGRGKLGTQSLELPILAVIGLASLLMLATLVALLIMGLHRCEAYDLGLACLIFGPSTCALAVYVAWRCIRMKRDQAEATSVTLCGAALAGGLNIPLVAFGLGLVTVCHPAHLMGMVTAGVITGITLGCPVGLVFGILCLPPIKFGCTRPESVDGYDLTIQFCWRWLGTVASSCALLLAFAMAFSEHAHDGAWSLFGLSVLVVGLSRWVSGRATQRLIRRRLSFERIQRGLESGWTIVRRDEISVEDSLSLPPLFLHSAAPLTSVLARRVKPQENGGAYRRGERLEPVALVPALDVETSEEIS